MYIFNPGSLSILKNGFFELTGRPAGVCSLADSGDHGNPIRTDRDERAGVSGIDPADGQHRETHLSADSFESLDSQDFRDLFFR